jgi:peroxiredoxin
MDFSFKLSKTLPFLALLLLSIGWLPAQAQEQVILRCEFQGCVQLPSLFQFDGRDFKPKKGPKKIAENVYQFTIPAGDPAFYYVGTDGRNRLPVILGGEPEVRVKARCSGIVVGEFENSPLNSAYVQLKEDMNQLKTATQRLVSVYPRTEGEAQQQIVEQLKTLDEQKLALLDSAKTQHPYLGHIVGLNTYLSYQNNPGGYSNEIEYFASEFFRFADFKDPAYNHLPWVYESFRSYTQVLMGQPILTDQQQMAYFDQALSGFEAGSPAHKLALSGILAGMKQQSAEVYLHVANQFVTHFEGSDPGGVAKLKKEMEQVKAMAKGSIAPDFTQNNTEGEAVSLSDFRGKVLLVDFWASWCGPCRRENPNVVKLYERYKDQGFEILGVSLDRKKDRWLQAIEADGLTWPHVSDLKGWQNEAAKLYGVSSIPDTLLIDREGKIVARKLRGPALEKAVAELMGK